MFQLSISRIESALGCNVFAKFMPDILSRSPIYFSSQHKPLSMNPNQYEHVLNHLNASQNLSIKKVLTVGSINSSSIQLVWGPPG